MKPALFTTLHMEAALCLWEAMLESRDKLADLDEAWNRRGTVEMRHCAIQLAPAVGAVWDSMTEEEQEACIPYDWEFVPLFLRCLTWEDHGPGVPTSPRLLADRILAQLAQG